MILAPSHRRFLADLVENGGARLLRDGAETLPGIKALVHEGYIRLVPARCGPLGVGTGGFVAQITDAGRTAFLALMPPNQ